MGDENESVRLEAAKALGKIGDTQAVQPLIKTLRDENKVVREFAASVLGRIGDSRAVRSLKNLLKDEIARVHKAATRALEQIKSKITPEEWAKATEEKVKAQVKEEVEEQQTAVVQEKPSSFKKYIIVVIGAFILLGGITVVLLKFLKDRSSSEIYDDQDGSESEEDPFGEIEELLTAQSLISDLGDEDFLMRKYAADNLGQIGDKQAIKPLVRAFKDNDQTVRTTAKLGLALIQEKLGLE